MLSCFSGKYVRKKSTKRTRKANPSCTISVSIKKTAEDGSYTASISIDKDLGIAILSFD